ncbi:hypothetical protein EV1_026946 [Malus domestica]
MTMGISEFTTSIPVYGNGTSSSKPGMNFAKSTARAGRTPSTSATVEFYKDDGTAGDDLSRSKKPPASAREFQRDDKEHCDYMHPFRGGADIQFRHAEEKREGGVQGLT